MNEREILNNILKTLNDSGVKEAYVYVFDATRVLDKPGSLTYNFLYCLASLSGKTDESLSWVEEAVLETNTGIGRSI